MFRNIIEWIKFNFWYFIIRPLKQLYNFIFRQAYFPDNQRNRELIEYCSKIMMDEKYEPSTPVEHWIDKEWEDGYKEFVEKIKQENKDKLTEEELAKYIVPYNEYRPTIASEILITLSEYMTIKDR